MIEYLTAIEKIPVEGFVLRTLVVGIEIFILGRYLPRRAGGPFSAYDFAFFWMMGGLAASPLYEAKISFIPTFIAAATIYALHYSLSSWATRSRTFTKILTGEPTVLIANGKIIRESMAKSLLLLEILLSELRTVNVFNLHEVEYAILETSGHVSVIKKSGHSPATAQDLQIAATAKPSPLVVINDGHLIKENLATLGYIPDSFRFFFKQQCPLSPADIYLATLDSASTLYYSEMSYGQKL